MSKKKLGIIYSVAFVITVAIISGGIEYFHGSSGLELVQEKPIAEEPAVDKTPVVKKPVKKSVKIYVCGEVNNPGVYELIEGDRVEDAIALAGGTTDSFYAKGINLAKKVSDEDIIVVPSVDDPVEIGQESGGKVNINTADMDRLKSLNGIGESTAKAIIRYREKNGGFKNIEDILSVDGIGPKKLEGFVEDITIK